jgi:hypothetical protein
MLMMMMMMMMLWRAHDFTQASVQFRFAFGSDAARLPRPGVAIDAFVVKTEDTPDCPALLYPVRIWLCVIILLLHVIYSMDWSDIG